MALARFTRAEFLAERWNHQPGESVFLCQPSQGGKTHWAFDLLDHTPHVRPPVALVMKPRDPTPAEWTRRLGWKETPVWPPPPVPPWQDKPPGYTLWPRHSLSLDPASITRTNEHLKRQFEACLMDAYKRGDRVVFVDEIYGLLAELHMGETVNALLTRGMVRDPETRRHDRRADAGVHLQLLDSRVLRFRPGRAKPEKVHRGLRHKH
jgi:hypothetical protein